MSSKLSGIDYDKALNVKQFGASRDLKPSDPIQATPMLVAIEQIHEYDRNPRRERNSVYDQIKDAIRVQGLYQWLVITRRPGEEHYIVDHGGNTRLRIVKELYEETGDERFAQVHCVFRPWTGEASVLTSHLTENDVRGPLTFIDRARAIRDLRDLVEQEAQRSLSQREFAEALKDRGYQLRRTSLGSMEYALENLWPAIPQALRAGLGILQVERIRKVDTALTKLLESRQLAKERIDSEHQWLLQCLSRFDGAEFDLEIDAVMAEVSSHLSDALGEDLQTVRMDFQAVLQGHPPGPDAEPSTPLPSLRRTSPKPVDQPTTAQPQAGEPASEASPPSPAPARSASLSSDESAQPAPPSSDFAQDEAQADQAPALDEPFDDTDSDGEEEDDEGPPLAQPFGPISAAPVAPLAQGPMPTDLKSLRGRMWTLATRLAQRNGIEDCILPFKGGAGFLIDAPAKPLLSSRTTKVFNERRTMMVWWFLCAFAEQFCAPELAEVLPEDARMHTLLKAREVGDEDTPDSILGVATIDTSGFYLWSRLTDAETKDFVALIETSRQLCALAQARGETDCWQI